MKYLALLLCSLHILTSLLGQQINFHAQEITADGQLDEAIWAEITPFDDFQNFFPINNGAARLKTVVKAFHDGKFLNIAFVYHDSIPDVKVNSLKRDNYGPGFHLSDHVGIIIDPYGNQDRGYFFALNGAGAQLDALVANYDNEELSWDALWTSGVSVNGNDKIYEFKLPLSTFSYDEEISSWNFQFYTRDAKDRQYTVWNKFQRGFLQFDTRFLKAVNMQALSPSKAARTTIIPALTAIYRKDVETDTDDSNLQPSLDLQYKITDGLRLDATINPDFSQVEVDQQVTNLTRFNIIFPERRNFFIENSDLFTTLGADRDLNPFYSRFIGASEDILFGLKLSGNAAKNTRIGLLNVQSKADEADRAQNHSVLVGKQQFGDFFNATGYLINRQSTKKWDWENDFNRVTGIKANYLTKKRRWSGFATASKSFSHGVEGNNSAFSIRNNYNTRTLTFNSQIKRVGENYLTDLGFVPRLNNFDALRDTSIRRGYTELYQRVLYNHFPKNSKWLQVFRPIQFTVNAFFDESGRHYETNYFYNTALFFVNQTSVYVNLYRDEIDLRYAFDPLRNGELILPDDYTNNAIRVGWNSDYTRSVFGSVNFQKGSFFGGKRGRFAINAGYRMLPLLSLEVNYEYNRLNFDEQNKQQLHLIGLTTEVFFNNKLNWTTYLQYNEQIDNVNLNSRLQWEYQPLSFVYLVYTDNYDGLLKRKDWGISLKVNRRFNF